MLLKLVSSEESMSQENINALEESTIANNISNLIDDNKVEYMLDPSEVDSKISKFSLRSQQIQSLKWKLMIF